MTITPQARVAELLHRPACRLWRAVRIAWLRWDIGSDQQWIDDAQRAGIFTSENLRAVRRHMQAKRVRLALALAEEQQHAQRAIGDRA